MKSAAEFLDDWNPNDLTLPFYRVIMLLEEYGKNIIDECARVAMIQEEIPRDQFDEYDPSVIIEEGEFGLCIHSGNKIRDEHWVEVNKESILKIKDKL